MIKHRTTPRAIIVRVKFWVNKANDILNFLGIVGGWLSIKRETYPGKVDLCGQLIV